MPLRPLLIVAVDNGGDARDGMMLVIMLVTLVMAMAMVAMARKVLLVQMTGRKK